MTPSDEELSALFSGGNPLQEMVEQVQIEQFKDSFSAAVLQCMEQEEITLEAAIAAVTEFSTTPSDVPRKRSLLMECAGEMRHYFRHIRNLVQIDDSGNTEPKIGLHRMSEEEIDRYMEEHKDDHGTDGCNFRHS